MQNPIISHESNHAVIAKNHKSAAHPYSHFSISLSARIEVRLEVLFIASIVIINQNKQTNPFKHCERLKTYKQTNTNNFCRRKLDNMKTIVFCFGILALFLQISSTYYVEQWCCFIYREGGRCDLSSICATGWMRRLIIHSQDVHRE